MEKNLLKSRSGRPLTRFERTFSAVLHIFPVLTFVLPIPLVFQFFIPGIMWMTQKDDSVFIDGHGRASINFQLSWLLYLIVALFAILGVTGFSIMSMFSDISNIWQGGVALLAGFGALAMGSLAWFALMVRAAASAMSGNTYNYPLAIPFLGSRQTKKRQLSAEQDPLKKRFLQEMEDSPFPVYAETAFRQLSVSEKKTTLIDKILRKKFQPGELTFVRYQTAVSQVSQEIRKQLEEVEQFLKSAASTQQYSDLGLQSSGSGIDLASAAKTEIMTRLNQNEKAIESMSHLIHALNKHSQVSGLEDSLSELEMLTKRTEQLPKQ